MFNDVHGCSLKVGRASPFSVFYTVTFTC